MGSLICSIAAGNPTIIKTTDFVPHSSKVIQSIINNLDSPLVKCFGGDKEVTMLLNSLPFAHIIFTGSSRVGSQIMETAAKNLSKVTLELGGSNSSILH